MVFMIQMMVWGCAAEWGAVGRCTMKAGETPARRRTAAILAAYNSRAPISAPETSAVGRCTMKAGGTPARRAVEEEGRGSRGQCEGEFEKWFS